MVNETMPKKVYDISSSRKPLSTGYDIPFTIGKKEELHVYTSTVKGDTEVDSSKYNLSSDTKGKVATHITFIASYTFPEGSSKLTLIREVAIKQEIDLKEGEKISANIVEEGLDNAVRISLMIQEQVNRALLTSRSDEGEQIVVPNSNDRAGHILAFDEDGNLAPILTSDIETNMNKAQEAATQAEASKTAAATSALNAASSEAKAKESEENAKESEENAAGSEASVTSMKSSVEQTKTDIETEIAQAKTDIATAKTNAVNAVKAQEESSEAVVKAHEATTKSYAEQAATSATNADTSEAKAKASETKAGASESNAKTSETNAKSSETKAKTSEDNAKDSETAVSSMKADIEASKTELEGEITQAKSDIATAKADAVDTISSDKAGAVSAILTKKTESVSAVESAESTALSNIASDKADALSAIQIQKESSLSALQSQEASSKAILQAYEDRANTAADKAETSETNAKASEEAAAASATKLDTLKNNVSFSVDSSNSRIYHLSFWDDTVASFTIPADKFLKSASYDESTRKLKFVFFRADETEETVYVDISSLVDTYTAGTGLQVANNQFSLKIKTGETHFKADSNGIYLDLSDKAEASHTHTKSEITDFSHTHDDRYYTESEINTKMSAVNTAIEGKSDKGHTHTKSDITDFAHNHDERYYTEDETDDLLSGKSDTSHLHDDRYYTETEVDTKLALKSDTSHTHDGRYYTETEIDEKVSTLNTKINGKSAVGHTHTKEEITDFAHNHDERYYTETEIDSKESALNDTISAHTGDTDNPHGVTKSQVGLGNVDNTKDADKPISTAMQAALNTKQDTANLVKTFQSTPDDTHYPSEKLVKAQLDTKANTTALTSHTGNTSNPHNVTKNQLGLGNVLNVASYSKTEIDSKITDLNTEITKKQTGALVTAFQTTPDNTHYPSEKLVKDSLDEKSDTGHTHTRSEITDFSHTHDDRYYTESEIDTKLSGKSDTSHTHDGRYYTETEVDTKLAGKSDTSHTHDTRYYTEDEIDDKVSTLDTAISGKANSSHTHTKSQISDFPTSLPASDVYAWAKATTKPTYNYSEVGAAAASHNHDTAYYKKTETYTKTEIENKIAEAGVDLPLSVVNGQLCIMVETT